MSVDPNHPTAQGFTGLKDILVTDIDPNPANPRLVFPQDEIDRLAESIDLQGILVPVVVFQNTNGRYTLVDGERRFKCALLLGLKTVPAVVTHPKTSRENLVQMFNIHLVREPWQDMPTAWALKKLIDELEKESSGKKVTDTELSNLTGLSKERIQRLRHALELPKEYQSYIHEGLIPLNWFWELKKNVIEPLAKRRTRIFNEYGVDRVQEAFVAKRLAGVITDTVSLRDVLPIIRYAAEDARDSDSDTSVLDQTLRSLIDDPDLTIEEAYEDTVQIMVEADKLARSTGNMVKSFQRLLGKVRTPQERDRVIDIGREMIEKLKTLLDQSQ
jgi:ParB/RepB/Spo0J family partition protein